MPTRTISTPRVGRASPSPGRLPTGLYWKATVADYTADLNVPPSTTVLLPSDGVTVSAGQHLDATASPWASSVQYELTGGTLNDAVDRDGHPYLLRLVCPVGHDQRSQRNLYAQERGVGCRWQHGHESRRLHHSQQLKVVLLGVAAIVRPFWPPYRPRFTATCQALASRGHPKASRPIVPPWCRYGIGTTPALSR